MNRQFDEVKQEATQLAFDLNNPALEQAISYCRDYDDLKVTVKQAHGVGSQTFKDEFKWLTTSMETETKHTPGPWLSLSDDEEHVHISSAVDGSWAAKERYIGRVTKRNALLVKAAPALLAVAKQWDATNEDRCDCDLYDTKHGEKCLGCATRAAIAKAEGG